MTANDGPYDMQRGQLPSVAGHILNIKKRELFAAMAMQGLLSAIYSDKIMLNEFTVDENNFRRHLTGCEAITKCAINYADALIKALE